MEENVPNTEVKPTEVNKKGLSIASMVIGIVAILGSWIPYFNIGSIILALVGVGLTIPAVIGYVKNKKGSLGFMITGGVLSILTLIIAISINVLTTDLIKDELEDAGYDIDELEDEIYSDNTEKILKDDLEVKIGKYEVDTDDYFETGDIDVEVKNIGDEKASFTIEIEAVDANGDRIDTDSIYVSDLGAGQSVDEDAFYFHDVDEMKKVTEFKILSITKY